MRGILKKIDKKLWNNPVYKLIMYIPRKALHFYAEIRETGFQEYIRAAVLKWQIEHDKVPPAVSIVMPVYNAEEYLKQTIDSLLVQSMKEIEIITVDDGSTDGSLEMLKKYAQEDKRVKVYTQKNKYAGVARNKGLKHARGEYVLFLDSDDFFEPELVEATYHTAKENEADVVMFGANCYNNETGKTWVGKHLLDVENIPEKQPFNCKDCPDKIFQISNAVPWTKMFRRKFIKKTGLNIRIFLMQMMSSSYFQHLQWQNAL